MLTLHGRDIHRGIQRIRVFVAWSTALRFLSGYSLARHEHSPAEASIVLCVDDSEEHWIVSVREGISAGVERAILGFRWFGCDALNTR